MRWGDLGERLLEELDWESMSGTETVEQEEVQESKCLVCDLLFKSVLEAKGHRRSKEHATNQRRSLRGLAPLSPSAIGGLEADSNSDSDSSSDEEDEEESDGLSERILSSKGSPFIDIPLLPQSQLSGMSSSSMSLKIYKQLILSPKDIQGRDYTLGSIQTNLKNLVATTSYTWTLLMLASGHFAGAIIDHSGKLMAHKTFHRYTTRRKQGGGQTGKDGSGKIANSAGSTLRRYNEQALKADIQQLLSEWKSFISSSTLIFIRATHSNRASLEVKDVLDFGNDSRIRSFPFTTGRPTLEELKRAWDELSTFKVEERIAKRTVEKPTTTLRIPHLEKQLDIVSIESIKDSSKEKEEAITTTEFVKALDLIRRGKGDLFKTLLQSFPSLLSEIGPSDGNSLLHVAAAQSQPDIVHILLKAGMNATLKNERKQTPYQVAHEKPTRDAFRRFIADNPEPGWDFKLAMIPGPLTREMEETKKAKEREKRRKNKERNAGKKTTSFGEDIVVDPPSQSSTQKAQKKSVLGLLSKTDLQSVGLSEERRKLLDREKRALAAEARMRSSASLCAACEKSMAGLVGFDKGGFKYCSIDCVKAHNGLHDPL